jgi:hypothetical protein
MICSAVKPVMRESIREVVLPTPAPNFAAGGSFGSVPVFRTGCCRSNHLGYRREPSGETLFHP